MRIRSSTGFVSQFTQGMDVSGREFLSLVVKGTFDFPTAGPKSGLPPKGVAQRAKVQKPLIMADQYTGAPGFSAPLWETDFAFRKARCDVLAQGAAYAPNGQPAERVRVGIRVGDWVKQFEVVGPRQWRTLGPSITATKPYPFSRLAFGYDTAFGGPDRSLKGKGSPPVYAENPVGLGYATTRSGSGLDGLDLPLTEDPADPVTSPFGAYRPMALGPIAKSWPQRARFAGTYDEAWIADTFPFLPTDFQEAYYQCAPEDQQIAHPAPYTPVLIIGLTPSWREEFRLPDTDLPVKVFRGQDLALDQILRPDTLAFDCEARQFTLTWRCEVPILRLLTEFTEGWIGRPSRGLLRAYRAGKAYAPLPPLRRESEAA